LGWEAFFSFPLTDRWGCLPRGGLFFFITSSYQADSESVHAIFGKLHRDLRGLQSHLRRVQSDLREVQSHLRSLQRDLRGLQSDLREVQRDLREVQSHLRGMQSGLRSVQRDLSGLQSHLRSPQRHLRGLQRDLRGVQSGLRSRQRALRSLRRDSGRGPPDESSIPINQPDCIFSPHLGNPQENANIIGPLIGGHNIQETVLVKVSNCHGNWAKGRDVAEIVVEGEREGSIAKSDQRAD
jgi:hypothetical protein